MTITLRLFGLDIIYLEVTTDAVEDDDPIPLTDHEVGTAALHFTPSPGDQRWERGAGGGEL